MTSLVNLRYSNHSCRDPNAVGHLENVMVIGRMGYTIQVEYGMFSLVGFSRC